jgi:hypothetical protein
MYIPDKVFPEKAITIMEDVETYVRNTPQLHFITPSFVQEVFDIKESRANEYIRVTKRKELEGLKLTISNLIELSRLPEDALGEFLEEHPAEELAEMSWRKMQALVRENNENSRPQKATSSGSSASLALIFFCCPYAVNWLFNVANASPMRISIFDLDVRSVWISSVVSLISLIKSLVMNLLSNWSGSLTGVPFTGACSIPALLTMPFFWLLVLVFEPINTLLKCSRALNCRVLWV